MRGVLTLFVVGFVVECIMVAVLFISYRSSYEKVFVWEVYNKGVELKEKHSVCTLDFSAAGTDEFRGSLAGSPRYAASIRTSDRRFLAGSRQELEAESGIKGEDNE